MTPQNQQPQFINTILSYFLGLLFLGNLAYLICTYPNVSQWEYGNILRINGFTLLVWTLVTFFSALISNYSKNYLKGFRYHTKFSMLSLGFTLSIMVFVMANHIALLFRQIVGIQKLLD